MRALTAFLVLFSAHPAAAQLAIPDALPGALLAHDQHALDAERARLLAEREMLLREIRPFNKKCSGVPETSPLVPECRAEQPVLLGKVKHYQDALALFGRRVQCAASARQADLDRHQIQKLRETIEMSQHELADWSRLNDEAQAKAVKAAVKFTLGQYVADLESTRNSVGRLERHAAYLAKKAEQSRRFKTRMQYATQLDRTLAQLESKWGELLDKEIVRLGLDAEKVWTLARNTMHQEFRVARKHNDSIRELLADPAFREAFAGGDFDQPGLDALATLAQAAGEQAAKLELGLERYSKFTGPAVRAAVFVRDAAYAALASGLSTERVLQQNEVAGDLARASASLQTQYKNSVDALRACRDAGLRP